MPGAGTTFVAMRAGKPVDEQAAVLGDGSVRLELGGGTPDARAIVYLPEGMQPVVHTIAGVGGVIEPAPAQPRWLAYGDSIAEGWIASGPVGAWPAVAGREYELDVVNLGYAGSARGEIASAEQIAKLDADVISISHGTNCWTRVPFSAGLFRENTRGVPPHRPRGASRHSDRGDQPRDPARRGGDAEPSGGDARRSPARRWKMPRSNAWPTAIPR